jgi:hypothetical protein
MFGSVNHQHAPQPINGNIIDLSMVPKKWNLIMELEK